MQAGVGLLILDVMPIYMIIALDIVIIICSSSNIPTVICYPPYAIFLREATSEIYDSSVYFLSYYFQIYYSKNPKIPCCTFLFIYFILCFCQIYLSNLIQFYLSQYRGGIDNPSYTLGCKYFLFVCRCY